MKHLKKVKESRSPGSNGIHPKLIKETQGSLVKPLTIMFKKSLEEMKLPEIWKTANITTLHKNGDKQDPSSYRPICLTSVLCKLMKQIIRD